MNPSPYEPPRHPSELNRITRARSFVRFLTFFFIGVTGTLAWQSYGGTARETIASWSPRFAWLAPPPDQIVAISRDLTVMRQSVDKLAADVTKLQALQQVPARKPDPQTPSGARAAPPVR
jgi:hypothetical protein